ncbi:beta strand repeat-containing protein, partial [Sphingopyxis sp. HXXIV]|uniref:beta strand repeat-containing protein n=2 Tax=unclassified Sphingopyxis TaxID=2614943 RepID=UPI003FA74B3C
MRTTASTQPVRKGKQRLLTSCAIAAGLAALALGGPALAQGVAGSGQVVAGPGLGTATIAPTVPGTTRVTTNGAQTIINWTPTDTAPNGAPIDFLPATNTLEYFGNGNYTVLNRFIAIDPLSGLPIPISRQIALNGTVNSYVNGPAGVPATQGGNIWFYNAGGILIGARAVINVGSLVLTANDIDTTGGLYGANNEIRFRGAAGSTSSIDISPQSFISAANPGNPGSSYIALVAPRINQGGLIDVDGSAALVAAEQADITINNGLFDINVTVGAEGGNAITHTGVTGGPAHAQGDTDQSRVYLVAIPKNDAVTMLISGQLGYQDAVVAQTDPDGAVVLSAGYNIENGALAAAPVNTTAANITIADTIFQSSVTARASGDLVAGPLATIPTGGPVVVAPPPHLGRLVVQGNATFVGDASATVNVGANQIVGATGNFAVLSTGVGAVPGNASFTMTGGQFVAGGNLSVQAPGLPDAVTGNATGGTASLNIGGTANATVIGNVNVAASANAIVGTAGTGGNATGGTASITLTGGGVLNGNSINVQANGRGGGVVAVNVAADQGGSGSGGSATISVQDTAGLTANTSITIAANGAGQVGNVQSGDGTGGTARLEQRGIRSSITSPLTTVAASGTGGGNVSSPTLGTIITDAGGVGQGGNIQIDLNAAATSAANLGTTEFDAGGSGGGAGGTPDMGGDEGAAGGDGTGGNVDITIDGGIALNVGSLLVNAAGLGSGSVTPTGTSGTSGDGDGGTIDITVNGGSGLLSGSSIQLDVRADSGAGENRGNAVGGDVTVTAIGSGGNSTISAQSDFQVIADAGQFSTGIPMSTGTNTGGNIDFTADGGTIVAGSYNVTAEASTDNSTGAAGTAQGGSIDFRVANTGVFNANDSAGASFFSVDAAAGVSQGGTAANAGRITATIDGGTMGFGHTSFFSSTGIAGGDTSGAGNIVLGLGGSIRFELLDNNLNPSILNFQSLFASADGRAAAPFEGAAFLRGTAAGNGGNITVDVQGGQLTGNALQISADGFSGIVTGDTGEGRGGQAIYTQTGGAVTVGDLVVSATGFGGSGGRILTGGSGFGGTATIDLLGGTLDATNISAVAAGAGG